MFFQRKEMEKKCKEFERKYNTLRLKISDMEKTGMQLQTEISVLQKNVDLLEQSNMKLKEAIVEKEDQISHLNNVSEVSAPLVHNTAS